MDGDVSVLEKAWRRALRSLVQAAMCLLLAAACLYGSEAADAARQLMAEGKRDEAKALLVGTVGKDSRDDQAYLLLAKICARQQDYDKAAEYAERAVELADSVSEYHLWLARASLGKAMQSGMVGAFLAARKGRSEYEKAIERDPSNLDARFELCMYYLIAPGMVGGSKDKAEEQATVLEAKNPLYGAYAWAAWWEREQQMARAESLYTRAVALDTSSTATALYGLAYFYDRNKKYDQAGSVFKQIVETRPKDLVALFQLGRVYVTGETNLDEAERAFTTYLSQGPAPNGPDEAAAHWRLGMVYDLQGRRDEALPELREAVRLAPQVKQYKDTLKQVEKKKPGQDEPEQQKPPTDGGGS
jgi:tetratricopeptide (TPR) repeat protein